MNAPQGTIRDWLDKRAGSDATAFLFPEGETTLTWGDLQTEAARIAAHVTAQGVAKGDSVAVMHPNGRGGVLALFGLLYGGFRATMINLVAGQDAIAYALEHSEAKFAFVHDQADPLFQSAAKGIEKLALDGAHTANLHSIAPTDHALLMYTSGTTGRPKGVVHTHASLLAGGWTPALAHELTQADRGYCVLPIYHINGLCVTVMGTLIAGGSLVMVPKFSASKFWTHIEDTGATWFSVVPTIISHLLHSTATPGQHKIRFGRSASSALAPETQTQFENRFNVPIVETMGLTETAAQMLSNPLPPGVRKIGSPGVAIGNETVILSKELQIVTDGSEGEIAVRGPNVMLEYLRNPQATSDTFTPDGWLRTGDLGRQDADGYFYVTGRLKELIIKGGENIAPREIDDALYAHPDVVEAAAFACPCDSYGERIEAAVKLTGNSKATINDLLEVCTSRLGKFKSPDTIHLMDELPKGPSGKIQRLKLAELTK
ncbi:AMP-binding protein [Amylibacter sp. IMCC11727]|uniref:AMP-binding protein n=1 Tax=Amylibacter sp. IMCC11727 TaxID=3039851 RepID=UPI00244DCC78|nr:AMP-binding protein [Amylibacter sp. IMCC11727]WGI22406.1 AMP-binding protein [Amylibacter sp. IMCC11727]